MDQTPEATPEVEATTPTRVCPSCASLSQTSGEFCPHCSARFSRKRREPRLSRKAKLITLVVMSLLLVGSVGAATTLKIRHDRAVQAKHEAQVERAAAKKAAQEAARKAAREAEIAAIAAQQAEDEAEIAVRHSSEAEMEKSITKWARGLVSEGTLDEPILRSSCTPIGGGSENLTEVTVKYECLAITTDNDDGTSSGYRVHATMDFTSGEYQWGLGN